MKKKIVLIDGNSLVYRAFFALPTTLANSKGQVTNAVYGFTSMLIKLLKDERPDVVIAAFDRAAPTFRHDEYDGYKATRNPTPSELISQFPLVKRVLESLNIPIFEMDGYEADDVLATLAAKAEAEHDDVIVVTGDRDAFQMVDEHVKIMTTRKGISDIVVYDRDKVIEKYGIAPEQVPDYLALKGDTSDNIPGVPGIGEKTAAKLIQQFGSIENLLDNLDSVENKRWRQMLEDNAEEARLSKRLAVLERDVPIDVDYEDCLLRAWDEERIRKLFSELEFFTLLERFFSQLKQVAPKDGQTGEGSEASCTIEPAYNIIAISDQRTLVEKLLPELEKAKHVAIAALMSGETSIDQNIDCIAFAVNESTVYTCNPAPEGTLDAAMANAETKDVTGETDSKAAGAIAEQQTLDATVTTEEPTIGQVLEAAKPFLESKAVRKTVHDAKHLILALWNANIKPEAISHDTMIAAYLLNPERSDYPIDELAAINLGIAVPEKTDAHRLAIEAIANFKLKAKLEESLKEKNLFKLFEEVEMPLVEVLAKMEATGVGLNTEYLADLSKELERFLENIENEIFGYAEQEFNINSPQQLGFILFEKLGLPKSKKTKTGYSTDANVLNKLRDVHPIIEKIIAYRELAKLKSTYVDALPKLINPRTGKLHTSFNQTVTTTGRLSSSNPNLQNIPVRTELGERIREAFIPSNPGDKFLSADYSQIELRLLAHYSGEPVLLKAFQEERDIHDATAMEVFGVNAEQVTSQMRRWAKIVNFGVLYGMSPYGLSDRLGMPVSDAKKFIDRYFSRLPKVQEFIDRTINEARQTGYVETLLGRRRYIPEIKSSNGQIRSLGERFAVNAPLQGTAADIIKLAMVRIAKQLAEERLKTKMVLQVHDELIFEVPPAETERATKLITTLMENAYPLKVRLKVETCMGSNWKDTK